MYWLTMGISGLIYFGIVEAMTAGFLKSVMIALIFSGCYLVGQFDPTVSNLVESNRKDV